MTVRSPRLDRSKRARPDGIPVGQAWVPGGRGVVGRLSNIALPRRLAAVAPRPLTRIAVAFALLSAVGLVRLAIDTLVPGVTPFALLYPAVLLATLAAGWTSGGVVLALGGLLVWYMEL